MSTKFEPLGDKIVVAEIHLNRQPGDIILPDQTDGEPTIGEVLRCGSGHFEGGKFVKMPVLPGDIVFFSFYARPERVFDGLQYWSVYQQGDILGRIPADEIQVKTETDKLIIDSSKIATA